MREQLERDEQTVTIATALVLFVLVMVLGAVLALVAEWVADPPTAMVPFVSIATIAAATGISVRYVIRHRRP